MNRIVWTFNEICSDTSVVIITLIRMVGLKLNREKTTKTTAATRPLEKFSSSFDETYEMVECQMQFVRCQFSCRNFSIKYICMLFPCLSACKLRRTNESIHNVLCLNPFMLYDMTFWHSQYLVSKTIVININRFHIFV